MKNFNSRNFFKTFGKVLLITTRFLLQIFFAMLDSSAKTKKHKPSQHEIMCGEKLPFSGKYYIPEEKHK
jgi:hypothetical protein